MAGLSWEAGQYDPIVTSRKMNLAGTYQIVYPGNPAASFMYLKIAGDPAAGTRMPLGGPYLDQATTDLIRQWIVAGAVRNGSGGAPPPPPPTTPPPAPPPPAPPPPVPPPPPGDGGANWDWIQANILAPRCVVCHGGASPMAGLSWEAGQYDPIVTNRKMNLAGTYQIVYPGNPAASFMYLKIAGDPAAGARMPLGGPYLDQATIDLIQQWIVAGALRNGGGTPPPPPPTTPPPAPPPPPPGGTVEATWDSIQSNVLQGRCVSCHGGGSPAAGLSWEAGQYDAIVTGGQMNLAGTYRIVNPGNKSLSFMYLKIIGSPAAGERMPKGGPYLDQATMDLIGAWIDGGAVKGSGGGGGGATIPQPNWASIQSVVFQSQCVSCHGGLSPASRLSLEADQYEAIVEDGQRSTLNSDYRIVKRGDAERSTLYLKLIRSPLIPGDHVGAPNPDPAVIDVIRQWINAF
jgi:mono/diheme cytochrome c family protein